MRPQKLKLPLTLTLTHRNGRGSFDPKSNGTPVSSLLPSPALREREG